MRTQDGSIVMKGKMVVKGKKEESVLPQWVGGNARHSGSELREVMELIMVSTRIKIIAFSSPDHRFTLFQPLYFTNIL